MRFINGNVWQQGHLHVNHSYLFERIMVIETDDVQPCDSTRNPRSCTTQRKTKRSEAICLQNQEHVPTELALSDV